MVLWSPFKYPRRGAAPQGRVSRKTPITPSINIKPFNPFSWFLYYYQTFLVFFLGFLYRIIWAIWAIKVWYLRFGIEGLRFEVRHYIKDMKVCQGLALRTPYKIVFQCKTILSNNLLQSHKKIISKMFVDKYVYNSV